MIQLYNTLSQKKEPFKPLHDPSVSLYTCGPTVYNTPTIGNLRTYTFEDVLKRVLRYNGYNVKHVMNITDVGHLTNDADDGEDKIQQQALIHQKTAWDVAEQYTALFKNDIKALGIIEPDVWCKATDYIHEQIELIRCLEKKGYTYKTSDGIYFRTSRFPTYKNFARLRLEELKEGARIEKNIEKKNPTDFALWKFSPKESKRDMEWDSPWGVGFPGWHIECSSMSMKNLSPDTFDRKNKFHPESFETIDIHCGGIDHIPVHHTNEIAQSEAATDKQFAKYWLHGAFLLVNDDRMGKSKGNFVAIQTLKERGFFPIIYRYLLLQTHYRQPMNFTWESLEASKNGLFHLYTSFFAAHGEASDEDDEREKKIYAQKFLDAINDDLNTPKAIAIAWDMMKSKKIRASTKQSLLKKFDTVLGLDIENWSKRIHDMPVPRDIKKIMRLRDKSREEKNFKQSDELRKQIEEKGYEVLDQVGNTTNIFPTSKIWNP